MGESQAVTNFHGAQAATRGTAGGERPATGGLATEGSVLGLKKGNLGLEGCDFVAESLDVACGGGLGLSVPPVFEPVDTSARAACDTERSGSSRQCRAPWSCTKR